MIRDRLVLTCEHAGNHIPPKYLELFESIEAKRALNSHLGYDVGAFWAAKQLAVLLDATLAFTKVSRLLIDHNRSEQHKELFSEFSDALDEETREALLRNYHRRHRDSVRKLINTRTLKPVVHIAVHSFTPVLDGEERTADIAFLYDPSRKLEKAFCERVTSNLKGQTELRVRRNYPYKGTTDGLTTTLRKEYKPRDYLGIELEINQAALVLSDRSERRAMIESLVGAIETTIDAIKK